MNNIIKLEKLSVQDIINKVSPFLSEKEFANLPDFEFYEWEEEAEEDEVHPFEQIEIPDTEEYRYLRSEIEKRKSQLEAEIHSRTLVDYGPHYKELNSLSNIDHVLRLYVLGIGPVMVVDQHGGSGQGDHWHSVRYFPAHDVYIMVTGWYSSYEGTSIDDYGYEVFPKKKEIIVYEK